MQYIFFSPSKEAILYNKYKGRQMAGERRKENKVSIDVSSIQNVIYTTGRKGEITRGNVGRGHCL